MVLLFTIIGTEIVMEKKKNQIDKFKDAARDLETDNDEKQFDKTLGKIAKAPKLSTKKVRDEDGE